MSLNLIILPMKSAGELSQKWADCYDSLQCTADYALFGQIVDLTQYVEHRPSITPHPLPSELWINYYDDQDQAPTRNDKYGNELTFVYAEQLKTLKVDETTPAWNKAIVAFVQALPNDTPIILMWN